MKVRTEPTEKQQKENEVTELLNEAMILLARARYKSNVAGRAAHITLAIDEVDWARNIL